MTIIEAIILGIVQGLTEFLPISSSGHIEIGKELLNITEKKDLTFTVLVHGGTVLSTIVVFRKDIIEIFKGLRAGIRDKEMNESMVYTLKMIISMVPVAIVGLLFKDEIESFFFGNIFLIGIMLILTAILLAFTYFVMKNEKEITYGKAFIIGIAQSIAVLPGVSRSGATIATALLLKVKREDAAKFSFLMVIVPILGANIKDLISGDLVSTGIGVEPLVAGFLASFVAGLLACSWMLKIVKSGNLIYFTVYCLIVGSIAVYFGANI